MRGAIKHNFILQQGFENPAPVACSPRGDLPKPALLRDVAIWMGRAYRAAAGI